MKLRVRKTNCGMELDWCPGGFYDAKRCAGCILFDKHEHPEESTKKDDSKEKKP